MTFKKLTTKIELFEKLATANKEMVLKRVGQLNFDEQQSAFNEARNLIDNAMAVANKHSDLNPASKITFDALPLTNPTNILDFENAGKKYAEFARKLYEQGKSEQNNDKMISANQIMHTVNNLYKQISRMKAAWNPSLPSPAEPIPQIQNTPTKKTSKLNTVKDQLTYLTSLSNMLVNKIGESRKSVLIKIKNLVSALQKSLIQSNWSSSSDYNVAKSLIVKALNKLYSEDLLDDDLKYVPKVTW
jgi:hypothetical protein